MSVITLTARAGAAAVAAEGLGPEAFASMAARAIARVPLRAGSRSVELGELFGVRVDAAPPGGGAGPADGAPELRVEPGGLRLDGLGAGMRAGRLIVEGDAGDRLGAGMEGGELALSGSCGDAAGAEMTAGLLRIAGSAGHRAGGALPGSPAGMRGGTVLVGGSVGDDLGVAMRRGVVAVAGDAGARAGHRAIAGTALVFGRVGEAPGLATKRGSLVVYGGASLLPSFRYACEYEPVFLRLYLRHLAGALAFPVPERFFAGRYRRFAGDFTQLGKGEVLLWQET